MTTAAANLHATAVQLRAMPRRALIDIAKAAKAEAARQGSASGAPLKGNKRRGMKLRAFDDIRPTAHGATCRIQGVNPAAWVWVSFGTSPHRIRRRKRGPKSKMSVQHPGTSGRGGWPTVANRVVSVVVPRVLHDQLAAVLR